MANNVGLMSSSEKAHLASQVARYEKNQREIGLLLDKKADLYEALGKQMAQVSAELNAYGDSKLASAERKFQRVAELDKKSAELDKKSAELDREIAQIQAEKETANKKAIDTANHGYLLNAITQVVLRAFDPSPQVLAKAANDETRSNLLNQSALSAKSFVEPILKKWEEKNTPQLIKRNEEKKCMHLLPGTVDVILDVMKKANASAADLTRFKDQIDFVALKKLVANEQVKGVLFAENSETIARELAPQTKVLVYCLKKGVPVEIKPAPMSVPIPTAKKETSPSSSPEGSPKRVHSSPEGSPPKNLVQAPVARPLPTPAAAKASASSNVVVPQAAKPLPKPPLPKPPVQKQQIPAQNYQVLEGK